MALGVGVCLLVRKGSWVTFHHVCLECVLLVSLRIALGMCSILCFVCVVGACVCVLCVHWHAHTHTLALMLVC